MFLNQNMLGQRLTGFQNRVINEPPHVFDNEQSNLTKIILQMLSKREEERPSAYKLLECCRKSGGLVDGSRRWQNNLLNKNN